MDDQFAIYVCAAKQYDSYGAFYDSYGRHYCPHEAAMVWDAKVKDDFNELRRMLEPCESERARLNQYHHDIEIAFMGTKLKIPYDAVAYNALIDALNVIEKEL